MSHLRQPDITLYKTPASFYWHLRPEVTNKRERIDIFSKPFISPHAAQTQPYNALSELECYREKNRQWDASPEFDDTPSGVCLCNCDCVLSSSNNQSNHYTKCSQCDGTRLTRDNQHAELKEYRICNLNANDNSNKNNIIIINAAKRMQEEFHDSGRSRPPRQPGGQFNSNFIWLFNSLFNWVLLVPGPDSIGYWKLYCLLFLLSFAVLWKLGNDPLKGSVSKYKNRLLQ